MEMEVFKAGIRSFIVWQTIPIVPTPDRGSPSTGFLNWLFVILATLKAERTVVFMSYIRTDMDSDVIHSIRICIKILSCNNCLLDIE